jgi:predicted RNA-binding Zn-ribbon protein involved in translation (DUF1610 family)
LSDRKYRQHGYQDGDEKPQRGSLEKSPRKDKDNTFGPRPVHMTGTHAVSRCAQCGTLLTSVTEPVGQCPKCGFELHSCKQCANFDPSSRFECMQRVPERIAKKDARNECMFYSISVRVEKQTSTGSVAGPGLSSADAARRALDNLFKD